jgi:hypothetical protein
MHGCPRHKGRLCASEAFIPRKPTKYTREILKTRKRIFLWGQHGAEDMLRETPGMQKSSLLICIFP